MAALVLAAIFAAMTERLIARRPRDDMAPAPALYAAGAVLSLCFAMSVGLATRFIPLALSLGAAGIVWVSLQRPVRLLSWLAVVSAGLAAAAIAFGPPFTQEEIGTSPSSTASSCGSACRRFRSSSPAKYSAAVTTASRRASCRRSASSLRRCS